MSSPISSLPAALLAAALVIAAPALAEREVQRTTGLSQEVYEKVTEIQTLAEAEQYREAGKLLDNLLKEKLSDYERAQAYFLQGFLRYQEEDLPGALAAYEQVIATPDLPVGMQVNVIRTLAQLHMMSEQFRDALRYADQLIATDPEPHADNHILKAQILYQMERMDPALQQLDLGIRLNAEAGLPPRENWLLLKNAIYYSKDDFPNMLRVVQLLTELYPRDRYLLNMAAIYAELGDSKKQLSLLEPLYDKGSLENATHIANLASLYMLHEIPQKAAVLLEKELESEKVEATRSNLEMLSQAWTMAGRPDRAVAPQKRAAAMMDNGRGYVTLARLHMSLLEWSDAEWALERAFEKGDLRDAGGARLTLGMAQFNQRKFREARRSFARAGEDPRMEKLAEQWLRYLEQEEEQVELARSVGVDY